MKKIINNKETPINTLPEYKIRTMRDDLAKITPRSEKVVKKAPPPEKLPIAPIKKTPLPLPPKPEIKKPDIPKPTPLSDRVHPKQKLLPILLIILLIVICVGGFVFWQRIQEPIPLPPPLEQPEPPAPLISVDSLKIISLTKETSLLDLLKQEAQLDQLIRTFKRMAVLKNEQEFLSLSEFLQELKITIPPYALAELKENHTLILYSQDGKKRLGLVAEIKNPDNLKQQLGFWEQTMVNDLKNLFLLETPETPASLGFQDNTYKDVNIRYINFPEPDLTIDYAIANNLFILTTSKESMYRVVDNL